jgi:NADPH-dependent curcumin reductase CurA
MQATTIVLKEPLDEGVPGPEHFEMVTSAAPTRCSKKGQLLVQVLVMSVDPYLRNGLKRNAGAVDGKVMEAFVCGQVLESASDEWKKGELFGAELPLITVQVSARSQQNCTFSSSYCV